MAKFDLADEGIRNIEPLRLVKRAEYELLIGSRSTVIGPAVSNNFPAAEYVGRLAIGRSDFIEASKLEPVYLLPVDYVKAPPQRQIPRV